MEKRSADPACARQRQQNLQMLQALSAGSAAGKTTLQQLVPMAQEPLLKAELLRQQKVYREINQEAHTAIAACGEQTKEQGPMARMGAKMGIAMKTMSDRSARTLAELVAEGAHQGMVDCIEQLRDCPQATPGAKRLAQRLQDHNAECIRQMQGYW